MKTKFATQYDNAIAGSNPCTVRLRSDANVGKAPQAGEHRIAAGNAESLCDSHEHSDGDRALFAARRLACDGRGERIQWHAGYRGEWECNANLSTRVSRGVLALVVGCQQLSLSANRDGVDDYPDHDCGPPEDPPDDDQVMLPTRGGSGHQLAAARLRRRGGTGAATAG